MPIEKRLDDLIASGWRALEPSADPVALQQWRRKVFDYMTTAYGPDHVYTRHFERFVRQEGEADLLIASGILSAAKEQTSCAGQQQAKANGNGTAVSLSKKIGGSIRRRSHT